jgi:hypothetical protein
MDYLQWRCNMEENGILFQAAARPGRAAFLLRPRLAATGGVPPQAAVSLCAASNSIPLTCAARSAVSRLTGPEMVNAPTNELPMPNIGIAREAA